MKNINFFELPENQLNELATFVVAENYSHHGCEQGLNQLYNNEVIAVCEEEARFKDSKIFVARNEFGELVGSIRVLKWNYMDILPLEKIFGISPSHIMKTRRDKEIWHIGRFAVKKGFTSGFLLFKTLMAYAINEVCKTESAAALAECDVKLLKTVNLLGIRSEILAESVHYLGSDTIPVVLDYNSLRNFLDANLHLLRDLDTQLKNNRISLTGDHNYTLV